MKGLRGYISANELRVKPRFAPDEFLTPVGVAIKRGCYRFGRLIMSNIPFVSRRRFLILELENARLRHSCFLAAVELNQMETTVQKLVGEL